MTDYFITKNIKFENKIIRDDDIDIPIKDAKFGILNLQAISAPLNKEQHEFVFMIDCSGSMSEECSDGKNKMQHIIHTLKNMIVYFKENRDIQNRVTIYTFDDKIICILDRCIIDITNFNEIISKIDQIMPRGSTNIELALNHLKKNVVSIRSEGIEVCNICNVFMTDGDATVGNCDHIELATMVDRNVTNAFIGFGIDHDAALLNAISDGENSAYYFIDKLENSGYIYGEILHSIIYKLLKNVVINIENGLIYDFKNNSWVQSLAIGEIASEAIKMYHICSNNCDECVVTITSNNSTIDTLTNKDEAEDLAKYIYRQRTLQHLFIVKDYLKRKRDYNHKAYKTNIFTVLNDDGFDKKKVELLEIKDNLFKFMEEMKHFMEEKNLNDDKIMQNLCDDIYICYRTFGTKFGDMYVSARQTSQGTQRSYNASHTPEDDMLNEDIRRPYPRLSRTSALNLHIVDDIDLTSQPILRHNVSNFVDSPYLTPSSAKVIQEITRSGNI